MKAEGFSICWQGSLLTAEGLRRRLESHKRRPCEIRLNNNQLESVPVELFRSDDDGADMDELVGGGGGGGALKIFVVDSNVLTEMLWAQNLPPSIERVSAAWNLLKSVHVDTLAHLSRTQLTQLSLHHNLISSLPPEIALLQNLRDLNLAHNLLVALPDLRSLKALTRLALQDNPLPACFALNFWLVSEIASVVGEAAHYFAARRAVHAWIFFFLNSSELPPEIVLFIARLVWKDRSSFLDR